MSPLPRPEVDIGALITWVEKTFPHQVGVLHGVTTPMIDWCRERHGNAAHLGHVGGPGEWAYLTLSVRFKDEQAAFEFKMRWG